MSLASTSNFSPVSLATCGLALSGMRWTEAGLVRFSRTAFTASEVESYRCLCVLAGATPPTSLLAKATKQILLGDLRILFNSVEDDGVFPGRLDRDLSLKSLSPPWSLTSADPLVFSHSATWLHVCTYDWEVSRVIYQCQIICTDELWTVEVISTKKIISSLSYHPNMSIINTCRTALFYAYDNMSPGHLSSVYLSLLSFSVLF